MSLKWLKTKLYWSSLLRMEVDEMNSPQFVILLLLYFLVNPNLWPVLAGLSSEDATKTIRKSSKRESIRIKLVVVPTHCWVVGEVLVNSSAGVLQMLRVSNPAVCTTERAVAPAMDCWVSHHYQENRVLLWSSLATFAMFLQKDHENIDKLREFIDLINPHRYIDIKQIISSFAIHPAPAPDSFDRQHRATLSRGQAQCSRTCISFCPIHLQPTPCETWGMNALMEGNWKKTLKKQRKKE